MENFHRIAEYMLTFNIRVVEVDDKSYYVVDTPFSSTGILWNSEFTQLRIRAVTELLCLSEQAAERQIQRLKKVLRILGDIVDNKNLMYERPEHTIDYLSDFSSAHGIIGTERLSDNEKPIIATHSFFEDFSYEVENKLSAVGFLSSDINFHAIEAPKHNGKLEFTIYKTNPEYYSPHYGDDFNDTVEGYKEFYTPYSDWEKITGYSKISGLSTMQIALRHYFLVKAGVEAYVIPKHVGEKYKHLRSAKNIEKAYGELDKSSRLNAKLEDLNAVLSSVKRFPEVHTMITNEIELRAI